MDIKEIIKWFIPCFHILLFRYLRKMNLQLTFVCLFLFFSFAHASSMAKTINNNSNNSELEKSAKTKVKYNNINYLDEFNIVDHEEISNSDQSDHVPSIYSVRVELDDSGSVQERSSEYVQSPRTFGRPFKKLVQALIPLVFQLGAMSTWAVVAALIGFKTLILTLIILKLLLLAGATKIGALFGQKFSHGGWEAPTPHQKEIHVHIHNGQHGAHEEHVDLPYSSWNRDGTVPLTSVPTETKNINIVYPYASGPQTISTPYGHYVKIDPEAMALHEHSVQSHNTVS